MNKHFESNHLYTVSRDDEYYILTYNDGTKYYWLNGKCQRDGAPAVIFLDGTIWWGWNGIYNYDVKTWDEFIIKSIIQ